MARLLYDLDHFDFIPRQVLLTALLSIAHNSCCAPCQEAAMVARLALKLGDKENGKIDKRLR